MFRNALKVLILANVAVVFSGLGSHPAAQTPAAAQRPVATSHVPAEFYARAPNIIRKVLDSQEVGGHVLTMSDITMPVGGREGRHKHAGIMIGLVEQGVLSMDHEPTGVREYKAGETFYIPEGQIHEGFNKGTVPTKVIGSFVIKKGEAIATPVP